MNQTLSDIEQELLFSDDISEIPPPDIIAYNELRSCADLFRMYKQGILEIHPEFQREIVWNPPAQTRFIDSLIKQLPIPSMCFSLDFKRQKWQVIDGLQRIFTIIKFLSLEDWSLSKLTDIDSRISGKHLDEFADENSELHDLYIRVENLTLPITVIRCDYGKKSHSEYLFTIFHRLNSGGVKLNNQEIRNCIYSGNFNHLINELNEYPNWMKLNRMHEVGGSRFAKQEIILRLFCFFERFEKYGGRLASFLNDYMNENRNLNKDEIKRKKELFERTVDVVFEKIFEQNPPKLTITVLESLLVGISLNLQYVTNQNHQKLNMYYEQLISHEEFSEVKLLEGLSGKQRVIGRLKASKEIFAGRL